MTDIVKLRIMNQLAGKLQSQKVVAFLGLS